MKKLLYRKTILKNLYYFSKNLNSVMDYEDYKMVILNDEKTNYKYIELLKKLYLSHYVILENRETDINDVLLFFEDFILKEEIHISLDIKKDIDEILEKLICDISIKVFDEINRYAFMYLLINYIVYLKYGTIYRYSNKYMKKLYEVCYNKELFPALIILLKKEIKRGYFPDIEFYKNLKEISKKDIITTFINNKEKINKTFSISHLYLFGSFAKDSYRIDSDIDVAVIFNENISYRKKQENAMALKEYIKETFKRYGDIMEYNISIFKNEKIIKIY